MAFNLGLLITIKTCANNVHTPAHVMEKAVSAAGPMNNKRANFNA